MTAVDAPSFCRVEVRRAPLVAWVLALAGGIAAMLWLGEGHLATPALTDPGGWGPWLARRDPLVAAMAVFRLLVLAIAWYLVGVTAVSLVAHVARVARLVRLADALAVPVVRRVTQQAVGVALATAAVATVSHAPTPAHLSPPVAAGTSLSAAVSSETLAMQTVAPEVLAMATEAPETLAMTASDDGGTVAMAPLEGDGTVRMQRLDDAYRLHMQRLTDAPPDTDVDDTPAGTAGIAEAGEAGARRTHTVAPGDHLWAIAEDVLAAAWGRPASDDEVERYWRVLIEENRDRLSNPDDPDLLLPGQVLVVPAVPPSP